MGYHLPFSQYSNPYFLFYKINQLLDPIFHVCGPGINNLQRIKVKLGIDISKLNEQTLMGDTHYLYPV